MAIRIETALNQINSYPEMDRFLANSEASLSSIIGSRMLSAPGYEGEVYLDDAVRRWFRLDARPEPFSAEEQEAAESGRNRLITHYRTTDRLLNESYNILVVAWRALTWLISAIIFHVDEGVSSYYIIRPNGFIALGEARSDKRSMNVFDEAWLQQGGLRNQANPAS